MSAMTKPMYRKYYEVWAEHKESYGPKTALLYQVGGFFELYDTENLTTGTTKANIREIAELCQLSLTAHPVEGTQDQQTLFGGFPEHALGKFERILVQAGFTVVVVVQRKGRTGSVEERVVDHISSPGCYVEGVKERRLVGIVLETLATRRVYWAATALDVATGRIWFVEGADRDRLHQFLCIHPPAELVLWSDGGAAASGWTESLRSICAATHIRCLASASVALEETALGKHWPRGRLTWTNTQPQARRCLAALITFAAEHVPSALRVLAEPEAWVPTDEVRLGNAALEQLGLLSLRGEDKQSLLGLMDQCRSVAGRRALRSRLMRPVTDVAILEARLDRVAAATAALDDAGVTAATERALRSLYDMSRLWRRLELGTATLGDMACLLRSYEAAADLMRAWSDPNRGNGDTHMLAYIQSVFAVWDMAACVEIARENPTVPVRSLPWNSGAQPAAESVFERGAAIRAEAAALCGAWSAALTHGKGRGEQLYLDDAEGGGFRVTGTKRRISSVLTMLRDSGDKSAVMTQYKSSAVLETATLEAISARHRTWWIEWSGVWFSSWSTVCAELATRGRSLHASIETWCADLDVSWTVALLARDWLWKRPVFVANAPASFVEVTGLRHPILERIQTAGVNYVSHSVSLGTDISNSGDPMPPQQTGSAVTSESGLLLYGMNASGKSSLMKALGLCVLLAQCGLPVPAASCRLAPFSAIFTRILGNDNLWAGLSSFAVEMTEFREILQYADERTLVLGDELCSGTESLSATALVAAGVEVLVARGTKFIFATHLHELAALPDIAGLNGVKAVHLKVHYDAAADRLVYDRHLAPGSGSALYGLEVCRALDLPTGYLDRATALRQTLAGWQAPTVSSYSAASVVDRCAVCDSEGKAANLETHHIKPQAERNAARNDGVDVDAAGNLVCLCAACHDDHHAGRLFIKGWTDTSAGRRLDFTKTNSVSLSSVASSPSDEVVAWVRDQKRHRIRVATIQRMAKQIFGVELTDAWVRGVRLH
jgi:DNA mismatch repair protein MutS